MNDIFELKVPSSSLPRTRVMDVTLRDGGFRTAFRWTLEEMVSVVRGASEGGADAVELGYVGGVPDLHNVGDTGPAANLKIETIDYIRSQSNCKLAAMVHPSAVKEGIDFRGYKTAGLDIVRLIYNRAWEDAFGRLIHTAADAGLLTCANIALVSRYPRDDFARALEYLSGQGPHVVYLADTCAGLLPTDIPALVRLVRSVAPTGFHGHDFLSLALANSMVAAKEGAEWIDASICGIGRGAGNLRLELWLALLARQDRTSNFGALTDAIELIEVKIETPIHPDLLSLAAGALNLSPPQEDQLRLLSRDLRWSSTRTAAYLFDNFRRGSTIASIFDAAG